MKRINIAQLDEDAIERLQFAHPGAEFYHDPAVEPGLMSEESPAATNLLEMPAHVADAIDQLEDLPACTATPGCIGKAGHEDDCIVNTTLGQTVGIDDLEMDKEGQLTVRPDALAKAMEAAAEKLPAEVTGEATLEEKPETLQE